MVESHTNGKNENRYLQLFLDWKFCAAEYALVKPVVGCVGMNLEVFASNVHNILQDFCNYTIIIHVAEWCAILQKPVQYCLNLRNIA